MPTELQLCLSCGERAAQCRGLCMACYNRLGITVRQGETTWAALEALGQARAPQKAGDTWMHGFRIKPGRTPP